jgi:hypothetical protein
MRIVSQDGVIVEKQFFHVIRYTPRCAKAARNGALEI